MHRRADPTGDPDHVVGAGREAGSQLLLAAVDPQQGPQATLHFVTTTARGPIAFGSAPVPAGGL